MEYDLGANIKQAHNQNEASLLSMFSNYIVDDGNIFRYPKSVKSFTVNLGDGRTLVVDSEVKRTGCDGKMRGTEVLVFE